MINILDSAYCRKMRAYEILAQQELFELKYNKTTENASEFLNKFETAVNKLKSVDEIITSKTAALPFNEITA